MVKGSLEEFRLQVFRVKISMPLTLWLAQKGPRQAQRQIRSKSTYIEWNAAATLLDERLGNNRWKKTDEYSYYDHKIIRQATEQLKAALLSVELTAHGTSDLDARVGELKAIVEVCTFSFPSYTKSMLHHAILSCTTWEDS